MTTGFWRTIPAEVAALMPDLQPVARIETAARAGLDAAAAARVVADLHLVTGWLTRLHPHGSEVEHFITAGPADQRPVAAGEGFDAQGRVCHIGPDGAGGLAVRLFAPALGEMPAGFAAGAVLAGLLVERYSYLAVREALGTIAYDLFWQATQDFGTRQRLALFAGFGAHRNGEAWS